MGTVRFARYVALEILLATALVTGVGVGSRRALSALSRGLDRYERQLAATRSLRPHGDISAPPDFAIATEPVGVFNGMSDELLLARARSGRIVRAKLNRGGSSISFRLDLADGSRAAFKPVQTNLQTIPRKEVAAYRLNRLLGLTAVPPAATRAISRDELLANLHPESLPSLPRIQAETLFDLNGHTKGVVMYWIPEIADSGFDTPDGQQLAISWLTQGNPIPPDKRAMAAQISELVVFDFLTDNPDRYSGGNMKMSPDGSRLYFMDNTMAFFHDPEGTENNRKVLLKAQRFSRRLYEALDRVSVDAMTRALAADSPDPHAVLTLPEMRAVVSRRDFVRRYVDALATQYGESNVLVFP
jgi:hypothetical protein